jgi:predicted small secreted protein
LRWVTTVFALLGIVTTACRGNHSRFPECASGAHEDIQNTGENLISSTMTCFHLLNPCPNLRKH